MTELNAIAAQLRQTHRELAQASRRLPPPAPKLPGEPGARKCLTCGAVCGRLECRDCKRVSARRALGAVGWGEVALAFAVGATLAWGLAWLGGAR